MKKIQRLLSMLLVCCLVVGFLPTTAVAADTETNSGTCGENLTWTLDSNGTLTISGTGDMEDYHPWPAPWKSSGIVSVIIKPGVTSIGERAFDTCVYLTNVSIPDSVTCMFRLVTGIMTP